MQNLEANSGLNEARTGFASDGCWGAPAENACVAQGVVRWHLWLVLGSAKTAPPGRRVIMKAGTPVLLESTGLQHLVVPWAAQPACGEKPLVSLGGKDRRPGAMKDKSLQLFSCICR